MVICLERGADLHMTQLMPLPLTVFCFSKIQIGFTFLVPAHPGSPRQRAVKRVCVCVCVRACVRACVRVCQIDVQVLQSLPDDIRSSIEQALQVRHRHRETTRQVKHRHVDTDSSSTVDGIERHRSADLCCDEQPGCSHWTNSNAHISESASLNCPASLPSYAQVICSPVYSAVFTCIGALVTPPSRTGPLARKYLPCFPYS